MVIINSAYEQITGRSRDELVSLGWAKITHPDDLDKDLDNFRKLHQVKLRSIQWINGISNRTAPSFGYIRLLLPLLYQIISNTTISVWSRISQNVKPLKKPWTRVNAVNLFSIPPSRACIQVQLRWRMDNAVCFWRLLNLTGYPPESLLYNRDLSFKDIISPEYHESLYKEWERTLPIRQPFSYEYEIITATGERKWVLERGQGVYNEDGEVEALEGIVLDISDRKAVEDTLRYNYEHDRWTGLYNREYLVSVLARDIKFRKKAKKALVGISLGMMQLLTMSYGFQYSQDLIKKTAEALSQLCIDNRILFHPREYRFIFYLLDYKDKDELLAFSKRLQNPGIFICNRKNRRRDWDPGDGGVPEWNRYWSAPEKASDCLRKVYQSVWQGLWN